VSIQAIHLTNAPTGAQNAKEECRMRLRLLTAVGTVALALAAPSAALAHHGRGHHHHHKTKANAHHAKFRLVHIGSRVAATTTTTPSGTTTPTTPPTPENAGTVTSYTGGVLTLTLNDGSTVKGNVTSDTRISCVKATTPPTGTEPPPTDQGPGDDNGQGDDQSSGDMSQQGDQGSGESQDGENGNGGGDDEQVQGTLEPPCDSSALVAGAVVRAAELRIGPGGTEFESILLVR
jgi:hypothetical protein